MMKTIDILPEGIRRVSGEQEAGAASCDNMLNLRYEYNALKVVGNKEQVYTNVTYEQIYEHKIGNKTNIIVVYKKSDTEYVIYDKTNESEVYPFTPIEDIDITFINNLMIVKMTEAEANGGYRIMTFIWRDDKYSLFYNGELPDVPEYSVEIEDNPTSDNERQSKVELLSADAFIEQVKALENKIRLKDSDNYTQGAILVSCNFTLFDNSQTKPSPPRMLISDYKTDNPIYPYMVKYFGDTSATMTLSIGMKTSRFNITPQIDKEFYTKNKDIIKSINFYSTMPKKLFDIDSVIEDSTYIKSLDNFFESVSNDTSNMSLNIGYGVSYSDTDFTSPTKTIPVELSDFKNIGDEIFYLQKSITLSDDISSLNEKFTLKMSESLMGESIMNVDASGYFRYYGKMLSYNNRIHLYDITRKLVLDPDIIDFGVSGGTVDTDAVVYVKTGLKDLKYRFAFKSLVEYVTQSRADIRFRNSEFVSFPDSRAYKIDLFFTINNQKYLSTISLKPSKTQNFAYSNSAMRSTINLSAPTQISIPDAELIYSDSDTILVSAQSNPAYYDNSNSYRVGGNITSICPITDSVSDLQVGQFPLAIFTDNGIYAISQGVSTGSSQILYSNTSKISEVVSVSKAIQTKTGVYFMADGGVYNLSGRIAQRISQLVEGEPDKDIYQNPSYKLICNNTNVYKIENLPSIKSYCKQYAVLAYDDIQDELFVSDGSQTTQHAISFVYNVKTKNWHSVDFSILFAKNKYAIIKNYLRGSRNTVVNINNETLVDNTNKAQVVHLQTRALTFGSYSYKTLQRAIARCDITTNKQGSNGMLGLYIFGSNDIKSWYLIGASQFHNGYTDKLQIQKIANNYKYFIFIIGGYVNKDSVLNRIEVMFNDKYNNKLR